MLKNLIIITTCEYNNDNESYYRQPLCHTGDRANGGLYMTRTLDKLRENQPARVREIGGSRDMRRRMLDMGIVPGTEITLVRRAPMRDPVEVRVKGQHVALRQDECRNVQVEEI